MKTALLRLAVGRHRGYRSWPAPYTPSGCIRLMVPRLGSWNKGPLLGWHLSWPVASGVRGVNATMHRKLALAIVTDILQGTSKTTFDKPL